MKDWMVRAIKTFVQAFFGVLIPEVCAMLRNGWPESWNKVWIILAPVVAAALAAAISAVWNIILEAMEEEKAIEKACDAIQEKKKDSFLEYNPEEEVEYANKH